MGTDRAVSAQRKVGYRKLITAIYDLGLNQVAGI